MAQCASLIAPYALLLANKGLSDESYAAAEETMGLDGLVASFSVMFLRAAAFRIDPPANDPIPLAA